MKSSNLLRERARASVIVCPGSEALVLIEEISQRLRRLEDTGGLNRLPERAMVDVTARLNKQSLTLERILLPLKDKLKSNGATTIRGNNYQAVVRSITKVLVVPELVRKLLDRRMLRKVIRTVTETTVTFEVKG